MSDDTPNLTAKEAIKFAADHFGVPSKYAMAKALSGDGLTVQPIQISNYLKGTRMSKKGAERFNEVYGIIVTDAFVDPSWAEQPKGKFEK